MITLGNLKIAIVVFSYKRWENPVTLKWMNGKNVYLYIPESEKKYYEKTDINIVTHSDNLKGLTAKYRQAFIDFRKMGFDVFIKIDDDIDEVVDYGGYIVDKGMSKNVLSGQEFKEVMSCLAYISKDLGSHIFGLGNITKQYQYSPGNRFNFCQVFDASIFGYIFENQIKVDDRFIVKADSDLQLQNLHYYGKTCIDNKYRQIQYNMKKNAGGLSEFRSTDSEQRSNDILLSKWGNIKLSASGKPSLK